MIRQRSLKQDMNDDSAFRHGRECHVGCMATEFNQTVPMFFTREGASIDIIGQYKGTSAFMICNGPSFAKLDHSLLNKPGIMTIGINNGPRTFRPDFWTCVDDPSRFLKSIWLDPKIMKFIPQAHFEKCIFDNGSAWSMLTTKVGDCPNVVGFRRNEKFVANRFLYENTIGWGNHRQWGGGRSVMLPAIRILHLLGFRKIYLLGCDLNMSENYTYHFDEKREKGAVNCNMSTYKRLKEEYFPQLKPYLDEEGVQVFNCNPDSALKVFPYKSYEEAVAESIAPLGDVDNERTYGLYSKPGAKDEFKEEPPAEQKKNLACIKDVQKTIQATEIPLVVPPSVIEQQMEVEEACADDVQSPFVEVVVSSSIPEQKPSKEIIAPITPITPITPKVEAKVEAKVEPKKEVPMIKIMPPKNVQKTPPSVTTTNSLLLKPLGQ